MEPHSKIKAFTLIELLVVITIIIVLIGMTSAGVNSAILNARNQKAATETRNLLSAINLYRSEVGVYPNEIIEDYLGKALSKNDVYGTGGTDAVFGPYYEFKDSNSKMDGGNLTPTDPWNNVYNYRKPNNSTGLTGTPQRVNNNGFAIVYSRGPLASTNPDDWIGTWQ